MCWLHLTDNLNLIDRAYAASRGLTEQEGGGGIAVQLVARAGALSLSPALPVSAGPDSNPFESPAVLREC